MDLFVGAEDVRVVLDEVPHAQKAVQDAGELVSVQVPGLRKPQRQVTVRVSREAEEERSGRGSSWA